MRDDSAPVRLSRDGLHGQPLGALLLAWVAFLPMSIYAIREALSGSPELLIVLPFAAGATLMCLNDYWILKRAKPLFATPEGLMFRVRQNWIEIPWESVGKVELHSFTLRFISVHSVRLLDGEEPDHVCFVPRDGALRTIERLRAASRASG